MDQEEPMGGDPCSIDGVDDPSGLIEPIDVDEADASSSSPEIPVIGEAASEAENEEVEAEPEIEETEDTEVTSESEPDADEAEEDSDMAAEDATLIMDPSEIATGEEPESDAEADDSEPLDPFEPHSEGTPIVAVPAIGVAEGEEGDIPEAETTQDKPKKKRHVGRVILIIVLVLVLICAALAGLLYYDDTQRTQYVPDETTLDGALDVSGMTETQLRSAVQKRINDGYSAKVTLTANGKKYNIDLSDVGEPNIDATVKQAYEPYDVGLIDRVKSRVLILFGQEQKPEYHITSVCDVAADKLTKNITTISKKVNRDPEEPGYNFDEKKRKLVAKKGVNGAQLDVDKTVTAVEKAITEGATDKPVKAVVTITKPKNTKNGAGIFIDTSSCKLYYYKDGKLSKTFDCTPGMSGYSTPTGDWTIEYKDAAPTWVNPHSEWAKSMPETIGPGESNPLGLRALALSCGGGIFIHGTTNTYQLGSPGSHGCIRLANSNILILFPLMSEGDPVFIR